MRKFLKITYYLGGVFIFVIIAIIGYTQTHVFKTYLRDLILQESKLGLNGQLRLGEIDGNLIAGFTIDGVKISKGSIDILSAKRIEISYDPLGLIFNRVGVGNAVILEPCIYIYRSVDGTLNIDDLIKPSPDEKNPSAWTIDIQRLELVDAEIIFTDSLVLYNRNIGESETPPDSVIDYARIHLYSATFVASLKILNKRYEAKVIDLHFFSKNPAFTLNHLSGDFLLTKNQTSARNVRIDTRTSHIHLDAGLEGVDIAHLSSLEELKTRPIDLSLTADKINTKDLKLFLYPSVDFLDDSLKLQVAVDGTMQELNIEELVIQMPHSLVHLKGKIRNLHHPRDLEMSVRANDNFVEPNDILKCLPGLDLPDLTFLGPVKYSFTYEGRPLDFKTHFTASTNAGDVDLDGKMKIAPENTAYSGNVKVQSVALGKILKDEKLASNINAQITVDGTGFKLSTMTGIMRAVIDTSSINGIPVRQSVFVFDVADGLLRSHIAVLAGSGNYEISSKVRFIKPDSTNYNITGKLRSIDLADLLNDKQYSSDISFDLNADGIIGTSTRTDTTELQFYSSSFGAETFETAEVKTIFNRSDSIHSALQITSTMGDLDVTGKFTLGSFITALDNSYRLVTGAIAHRFRNLDSLRSSNSSNIASHNFISSQTSRFNPIDADFNFLVRDFKPIGVFIHVPLSGQGLVKGKIAGDSLGLQLGGDLSLDQFGMRSGTDTLDAGSALFHYSFGGINNRNIFEKFNSSIETNLKDFDFNSFFFNSISGRINVRSDSSEFMFSAFIDSTARIDIEGASRVDERVMDFDISKLRTELSSYIAENIDTVRLILGSDGFRIGSFAMVHGSEKVKLDGYFSPSGTSDLSASISGFDLSDLKKVLHRGSYGRSSTQFSGVMDATASFRGSFKDPNIVVDLKAENVKAIDSIKNKYKELGRLDSHLSYDDHFLNLLVKFLSHSDNPQASPDLLLSGSLPYEFVLAREAPHKLAGEVDLSIKTTGLNLEFLNPFIPELSNLAGVMTCDMRMKGPIDLPRYEGSMSIRDADFVFDPLGMQFVMNGDLVPHGSQIQLERFTISNVPDERFHVGTMNVSGNFTLLGLKLKQFDFLAQGDLKVMSEEKRIAGLKLYGNLFAATGPDGLEWQGDLTASMVRGNVYVKDAQLVLPPEQELETRNTSAVKVTFKDDTTIVLSDIPEENIGKARSSLNRAKKINGPASSSQASETVHSTFLDGISYDVGIETKGPTQLRFVFNTQTSEELFADLQGRVYFNRTLEMSRLTGQVEVGNLSYYNFIKKFEANGQLLFTGDILNPELDVSATYQGTHTVMNSAMNSDSTKPVAGTETAPQVLVTLKITGTRNEPKTKVILQTKLYSDNEWTNWTKGDDEANAMTYIIAGQYRDEMTEQQRVGLGANLGSAIASGMASGVLSDLARRSTLGYVQSVDVIYGGGQLGQSDLRVTGQVGEMVVKAGGRVLSGDFGNTNASIELPLSYVLGVDGLRNLIFTIEHRVEGIQNAEEQRRATNGARLFYRFIF